MVETRTVLVVSRDPVLQRFLGCKLGATGYRVLATEVWGEELKAMLDGYLPDFIILDAMMPMMQGIEVSLRIRQWSPVPVMMLSTWGAGDDRIRRLDLDTDDYLTEPFGVEQLVVQIEEALQRNYASGKLAPRQSTNIVVIGSSTGGPKTLGRIFSDLPRLKGSIIVVQHMPKFINQSVRRTLDRAGGMEVAIAEDGEIIGDGKVYLAPSEVHLEMVDNRRIRLLQGDKVNYVRPAIDVTMRSLRSIPGDNIMGVVLTGMGKDGADGISHIKRIGGTTVAQDEETCAVYGMPKAAIATGMIDHILCPEGIRDRLVQLAS